MPLQVKFFINVFNLQFRRTSGLPSAVYDVDQILMFCMLNDGGCAPTPLLSFRERIIYSFVGHAVSIVLNSNMVTDPKQQIE